MDLEKNINTFSILIFIWSFIIGVWLSSLFSISALVSLLFILVGTGIIFANKIQYTNLDKQVFLFALVFISFGLGIMRYEIKDFHEPITPTNSGVVITAPEQRENTTRFVMKSDNGEKVLVNAELYSPVNYGDRVNVDADFKSPGIIDDGIGRPFDYAKYLSKDDIYFVANFASVEVVSRGHGNYLKNFLFRLRSTVISQTNKIFDEPESSLLSGLILAGKSALPKDVLEEFRRAGIIHIVVLSGYNITIIADFLRKSFEQLFLKLKRRFSPRLPALLSLVGVLMFVIMTGAEATVVRASLMAGIVIGAKLVNRKYAPSRALLVAGFFMVLHNPKILVFDPSFQLSFLATCALVYVVPIVDRFISQGMLTRWVEVRNTISTTVATQITVLPLLIYSMGEVSIVSLPANLLILFVIPYVMFFGFVSVVLSYVSTILSLPISYLAHLLLSWIIGVAGLLGNLSFAVLNTPKLSFWIVGLLYLVLIFFIYRSTKTEKVSKLAGYSTL